MIKTVKYAKEKSRITFMKLTPLYPMLQIVFDLV